MGDDPSKNFVRHFADDDLVRWVWEPAGRPHIAASLPSETVAQVKVWMMAAQPVLSKSI